jgi:dTDP-4-dehydrorhamnose reductase
LGAPTSAALIADVTAQVIGQFQRRGNAVFPVGLYHLAAGGVTNWCDYARVVVSAAHTAGWSLRLLPENIRPISTAEYPTAAQRPANSQLDTRKLQQTFGLTLPSWQDGLAHVLQQLL